MSALSDDARRMAKKYRGLAETSHRSDRSRFARMAEWWERRAAELDGTAQIETPQASEPDA
jgi:hypothetical protein